MPKLKQMSSVGIRHEMAILQIHNMTRWAEALHEAGELPECFLNQQRAAANELCESALALAEHLGFAQAFPGPK